MKFRCNFLARALRNQKCIKAGSRWEEAAAIHLIPIELMLNAPTATTTTASANTTNCNSLSLSLSASSSLSQKCPDGAEFAHVTLGIVLHDHLLASFASGKC